MISGYAGLSDLDQWIAAAPARARFIYAVGDSLPADVPPVIDEVRALADAGEVLVAQRRRDDGMIDYLAIRAAEPRPGKVQLTARAGAQLIDMWTAEQRVARLLRIAARFDRPAPSDVQIAVQTGCGAELAGRIVQRLVAARKIGFPDGRGRRECRVTIPARRDEREIRGLRQSEEKRKTGGVRG